MSLEFVDVDVKEVFKNNYRRDEESFHCNLDVLSDVADFLSSLDSDLKYERAEKLFYNWCKENGYKLDDLSFAFSYNGSPAAIQKFNIRVLISPSCSMNAKKCAMTYISEYTIEFKTGLLGFLLVPDGLIKMFPENLDNYVRTIQGAVNNFLYNSKSINVLTNLWVLNTPLSLKRITPYNIQYKDFVIVLLSRLHSDFKDLFIERDISLRSVEYVNINTYFYRACKWYKGGK